MGGCVALTCSEPFIYTYKVSVCMRECVCVYVRVCIHECMHACMCAHVCVSVCVHWCCMQWILTICTSKECVST